MTVALLSRVRHCGIGLLLIGLQFLCLSCNAEERPLQLYEQEIKAGLVYNLLKYTVWPKNSTLDESGKLQLCIFGEDPFDSYLSPLIGRTAQQSPIYIVHLARVADARDCSVVIVHANKQDYLQELFHYLEGKNTLTISDIVSFSKKGGMVEMTKEGDKVSLYINKSAVEQAGLSIQERMLKLAKIVSE